ncbi:MAG: hypothetical protein JRD68_01365 [Deltaproteobacteria bacterium]|nr:hypothetical protein [Deltaproteobacteria bacterium]
MSKEDQEMKNEAMVHRYFLSTLKARTPPGQFLMTKGRMSRGGIHPGEKIVFSYYKKIMYLSVAATGREDYRGSQKWLPLNYPHYFCVDMDSLVPGKSTLDKFEHRVRIKCLHDKNIVQAQSWPRLEDSEELDKIWHEFIA